MELDWLKKKKIGILYIDVDDFKNINDQYGHHVGDAVLIQISDIIKENKRHRDVIVRQGGEEVMMLCYDIKDLLMPNNYVHV